MMLYRIRNILAAAIVGCSICVFSKITTDHIVAKNIFDDDTTLTLIFLGDIMQHKAQIDAAWDDSLKTYVYDSCFKYVAPIIRSYDFAVANMEFTLGGPPYTGYPQFSAPDEIVKALQFAGIDVVATANNHSCDRGRTGIERTIKILDSLGLKHTGTFLDSASRSATYPMILEKNGIRLALLNYTYGTNGIPVPEPTIVNLIDEKQIVKDLAKAKNLNPDKIIVFIHWGDEYKSYPNAYQEYYAKVCFENGADIIIGMHPHVIQKMERYYYPDSNGREVFIAYSLGNYISNQRDRYRDGGAMVAMQLQKKNNKTHIVEAGYVLTWVYTPLENGRKKFYVLPAAKYETQNDFMDTGSYQKMKIFIEDSRSLLKKNIGVPEIKF